MKFDYCIGNPAYNLMSENTSDKPIYNDFMDESYKIAKKVELITPARFLFRAGKTPAKWNEKMLNDEHFKVLEYEPNSKNIFPDLTVPIKGGIAITYHDEKQNFGSIGTFTVHKELNAIANKVKRHNDFETLDDSIILQNRWNLENLYEEHPELLVPYTNAKGEKVLPIGSGGKERRLTTSIFSLNKFCTTNVFNDEETENSYKILGLINNSRFYKYTNKKYIDQAQDNLNKWKVILPKSNGTGILGETLSTPIVGEPSLGFTQSFISIGSFDNKRDAEALLKYIKTKFTRALLAVLKVTQDNNKGTWKCVPTQNFTDNSDIDWSKSIHDIDQQLYRKYGLSEQEIEFIESHVKEMD